MALATAGITATGLYQSYKNPNVSKYYKNIGTNLIKYGRGQ